MQEGKRYNEKKAGALLPKGKELQGGTSMNLYTAAQMREIDRRAIEERGIPSLSLIHI